MDLPLRWEIHAKGYMPVFLINRFKDPYGSVPELPCDFAMKHNTIF